MYRQAVCSIESKIDFCFRIFVLGNEGVLGRDERDELLSQRWVELLNRARGTGKRVSAAFVNRNRLAN